jgi:Mlc titration factor MtfA (ptsG expression regulator)
MVETLMVLGGMAAILAYILLRPALMRWRRSRLQQRPFPPLWRAILEQTVPFYVKLSPEERRRLQGQMQVFLTEKQFIGCAGLSVTEEMRVTIAAIACLLLLQDQGQYFPRLRSILLYPTAYRVKAMSAVDRFVVAEQQETRLGESWTSDQVVLAWEAIQRDVQHWQDGHNLVLHEFAHQLDQADGQAEGVPVLARQTDYLTWSNVMAQAYQQLCQDVQRGRATVMDSYGTTNPAEFFAVATETFFERPLALRDRYPNLYQQLQQYYQLDPTQWVG